MIIQVHGGVKASTTGNITGIYDMSGGSWERIAGYINNGHSYLKTYGQALLDAPDKHKQVYEAITSSGTVATTGNDNQQKNYENVATIFGDAVYEISSSYSNSNSWYRDNAVYPYSNLLFFERSGGCEDNYVTGIFCFDNADGNASSYHSFRPSLVVL